MQSELIINNRIYSGSEVEFVENILYGFRAEADDDDTGAKKLDAFFKNENQKMRILETRAKNGDDPLAEIIDAFFEFYEDYMDRTTRQDYKRTLETRAKNGNVEPLGYFEYLQSIKTTRVQLREKLRTICKNTSFNTIKRLITQILS